MKKMLALLLAMCFVLGMTTALADTQKVVFEGATVMLPAGIQIKNTHKNYCIAYDENCDIILYFIDYGALGIDPATLGTVVEGDLKASNLVLLMRASLGEEGFRHALRIIEHVQEYDFGLLCGETVSGYISSNFVICTLYYCHTGLFLYCAQREGGQVDPDAWGEIIEDIFRSFRLDGVTEEDMIADAQANFVVITAASGKIRTEASISGGLIRTAYQGESFELIREEGDWYVVDVNGRTGYIHKGVAAIQ